MATVRRRLYRGFTLLVIGALVAVASAVHHWTDPDTVRTLLIEALRKQFPGADVSVDAASFRILGGITVRNLVLYRRDDPAQAPFLQVPSGTIYHDKQALGQGRLAIRKIALERPRITVVRTADGRLNTDGILSPPDPAKPVPTITMTDGLLVAILESPLKPGEALKPNAVRPVTHIEVRDLQFALLNDPRPVLQFTAKGHMSACGPLKLDGSYHRTGDKWGYSIDWSDLPLGPDLLSLLGPLLPPEASRVDELAGHARLHLELHKDAAGQKAWRVGSFLEVRDGRLRHPDFPLPLDGLTLSAKCEDGQLEVTNLQGRVGGAAFTARMSSRPGQPWKLDARARGDAAKIPLAVASLAVNVEHLPITDALFARLPEAAKKLQQRFSPLGPLSLAYRFDRPAESEAWSARLELSPQGMTGRYTKFPYPLANVTGRVVLTTAAGADDLFTLALDGCSTGREPIHIRGWVRGVDPDPEIHLDLWGDGVPLDDPLVQSLPPKFQQMARSFHIKGVGDFNANIRHTRGVAEGNDRYELRFRDASLCYDVFPVPLDDVTGTLVIQLAPKPPNGSGDRFQFRDFQGTRQGGRVRFAGQNERVDGRDTLTIQLHGERVPLDGCMALAFQQMKLGNTWEMLKPSGRLDFDATVTHAERPDRKPDLSVAVWPRGATIRPTFFPLTLEGVSGAFFYTDGRVRLQQFQAMHRALRLGFTKGEVLMTPHGGFWADIDELHCGPVIPDEEFLAALPPSVAKVFAGLKLRGELGIDIRQLVIDDQPGANTGRPVVYWDGGVTAVNAAMETGVAWDAIQGRLDCKGQTRGGRLELVAGGFHMKSANIGKQPVSDIRGQLRVLAEKPDELQVANLRATLFGGEVSGAASIAYAAGLKYELGLFASGLRLEQFARQNHIGAADTQLEGATMAQLFLRGNDKGLAELEGWGSVDVPSGRIYRLPFLWDVLKAAVGRAPDSTAFEEAHAEFKIAGDRVHVRHLDLLGNVISLGGKGELKLDGSDVQLDFYAVWARLGQVLPDSLSELPQMIGRNLLQLNMRGGTNGQYQYGVKPLPFLLDPAKEAIERLGRRNVPRP